MPKTAKKTAQRVLERLIDPMRVRNPGFLLDMFGRDVPPLQSIRELVENSIEAITMKSRDAGGVVVFGLADHHLKEGRRKLAIMDTGCGMTGEEMMEYLNELSSSGKTQSLDGNFGMGAKIAALTHNRAGLEYFSWKDGVGYYMHLRRDPEDGQYGAVRQVIGGEYHPWVELAETFEVPPQIALTGHGTMVVLLGDDDEDDTMVPDGVTSPARWLHMYLNTRYFRFPENVTVMAPWNYADNARSVVGMEAHLGRVATASGQVLLTGATAHWWIVDESARPGHTPGAGHVAALFDDELYEMKDGNAGIHLLHAFGVLLGARKVVVYVEPDRGSHEVMTDTLRSRLIMDGEALPWSEWAHEFSAALPEAIQALGAERETGTGDIMAAIRTRLEGVSEIMSLGTFRRTRGSTPPVGNRAPSFAKAPVKTEAKEPQYGPDQPAPKPKAKRRRKPRGGSPFDIKIVPTTESEDASLSDRAVAWVPEHRTLLVNTEFRGIREHIERWTAEYGGSTQVTEAILEDVISWYCQPVVEAITRLEGLRGQAHWTEDQVRGALTPEALTAVALPVYHTEMNLRRAVRGRFGKSD